MKKFNENKYFTLKQVIEKFEGDVSKEDVLKYIKQEKIIGKTFKENWYIKKSELKKLQDLIIRENIYFVKEQYIDLSSQDLNYEGRILDVGGGGEGVIGQLLGRNVVSIDIHKQEFEEAIESGDNKSLKIIMDAREMKFLDNSFDFVTAFFSLLYIPLEDLVAVFKEISRVLKEGGIFCIWDLKIPKNIEKNKKIYGIQLKIKINGKIIETGYGVKWNKERNMQTYIDLGKTTNFDILSKNQDKNIFKIKFKKLND
ncbi:MAG: class I SAM-dependent methyltransferase [Promethearchaeati archaeon]